jgi:hypothetical protein
MGLACTHGSNGSCGGCWFRVLRLLLRSIIIIVVVVVVLLLRNIITMSGASRST